MNHLPIKAWSEDDRPREKLLRQGKEQLSDAELIAILLRNGTREKTAIELARQLLLLADNNLYDFGRIDIDRLSEVKGIGKVKAITLVAALELGRRRATSLMPQRKQITCSNDAAEEYLHKLSDLPHEEFWILLLNRANKIIDSRQISRGGLTGTVVDPKLIFKEALAAQACAIVLCHNHPSGNAKPSEADIQLTKKLKEGGKNLEIAVLDHVIIAGNGYYSFADEGLL